ncbi:MAG: zinc ribbon domain-containing protein [Promethearchaeota archaeon]|nr:MAG: zinc ribbon domain-containing protein [Candidatus Lokiarchaeota archaeon]
MKVDYKWMVIGIIGGIFMIIGNFSGLQIFQLLIGLYFDYGVPYVRSTIGRVPTTALTVFLTVILFIMAGGGFSVIIGTILIVIHLHKLGKLILTLGTGTGLIGISIFLLIESTIVNPIETWVDFGFFLLRLFIDLYFIGIILAIIARKKLKKVGPEEEYGLESSKFFLPEKKEEEEFEEIQKNIICPACKTANSDTLSYCSYCGTALKYDLERNL